MISATINNNTIQYRCAGKDCSNIGNILLRIKFINKIGYFCSFCADDLLHNELASIEESKSYIEASNCHAISSSKDLCSGKNSETN
jgi:hypothetical protein